MEFNEKKSVLLVYIFRRTYGYAGYVKPRLPRNKQRPYSEGTTYPTWIITEDISLKAFEGIIH